MGFSISLDIKPSQIGVKDWEKVYYESIELIKAYPFGTIELEQIHGLDRKVLVRAEEQHSCNQGDYWSVCGDMGTKRIAGIFELYRDLKQYLPLGIESSFEYRDIILDYVDGNWNRSIFSGDTNGEDYHLYVLAIACLIESRFEGSAIVYGDFDKEQAELAVDWANSILNKPINLPVRARYKDLFERLKKVKSEEVIISSFYSAICNSKEVSVFVRDNFSAEQVTSYYREKLSGYNSPCEIGAIRFMADLLDLEYSIESISSICCLESQGPKFDSESFIESLCSTWVFVSKESRVEMERYKSIEDKIKQIMGAFAEMILKEKGIQGLNIERYIPLDEFKSSLISIFGNSDRVNSIVDEEYEEIMLLEKICTVIPDAYYKAEYDKDPEDDELQISCTERNLAIWKPDIKIARTVEGEILSIKKALEQIMNNRDEIDIYGYKDIDIDSAIENFLDSIEGPEQLVQRAVKEDLILSKEGWHFFETCGGGLKKEIFPCLIGISTAKKDIVTALIENRELFDKYILPLATGSKRENNSDLSGKI